MYRAARPLLFRLDPERAHALAVAYLERLHRSSRTPERVRHARDRADPRLRTPWLGAMLPGPLGMAAGFDKNATCYNGLLRLGFGHVEVGTVTPRPQAGNAGPRLERHPDHEALVNRLGFNNPGADVAAERLAATVPAGFVSANVGPNRDDVERPIQAFASCAAALAPHVSAVTVNISSPNTPGLRDLQRPEAVGATVGSVVEAIDDARSDAPLLVKLHPDAPDEELLAVARAAVNAGAAGVVAVNTTTRVPVGLQAGLEGGVSGRPLRERADAVCAALSAALGPDVPIMGVGGISTGADVLRRMAHGAHAVQAYTAFVYRGPRFAREVHGELIGGLDRLGLDGVQDVVGQGSAIVERLAKAP